MFFPHNPTAEVVANDNLAVWFFPYGILNYSKIPCPNGYEAGDKMNETTDIMQAVVPTQDVSGPIRFLRSKTTEISVKNNGKEDRTFDVSVECSIQLPIEKAIELINRATIFWRKGLVVIEEGTQCIQPDFPLNSKRMLFGNKMSLMNIIATMEYKNNDTALVKIVFSNANSNLGATIYSGALIPVLSELLTTEISMIPKEAQILTPIPSIRYYKGTVSEIYEEILEFNLSDLPDGSKFTIIGAETPTPSRAFEIINTPNSIELIGAITFVGILNNAIEFRVQSIVGGKKVVEIGRI